MSSETITSSVNNCFAACSSSRPVARSRRKRSKTHPRLGSSRAKARYRQARFEPKWLRSGCRIHISLTLSHYLSLSIFLSLSLSISLYGRSYGRSYRPGKPGSGAPPPSHHPREAVKSSKGLGLIRELFWATYQDDPYYTTLAQSMMYYTRSCKTTVRHRATATPGDALVVDRNDTSEHMHTHTDTSEHMHTQTISMI